MHLSVHVSGKEVKNGTLREKINTDDPCTGKTAQVSEQGQGGGEATPTGATHNLRVFTRTFGQKCTSTTCLQGCSI